MQSLSTPQRSACVRWTFPSMKQRIESLKLCSLRVKSQSRVFESQKEHVHLMTPILYSRSGSPPKPRTVWELCHPPLAASKQSPRTTTPVKGLHYHHLRTLFSAKIKTAKEKTT